MSAECEWKFRASSIGKFEMFRVREFRDKHTCPLKDKMPKIVNPKRKYTPGDIVDDVKNTSRTK
ncbi:hypothetical protein RND71_038932 [Anisodus tanguticus]|uniref:Uncharacterized protein n=1 Tax=Anisodus tanguticus TaxID=243964 RepID=A0AAE1R162_9SOLA|nr:hypothetical protein RND71_038932 [Anisodus tanguticus]